MANFEKNTKHGFIRALYKGVLDFDLSPTPGHYPITQGLGFQSLHWRPMIDSICLCMVIKLRGKKINVYPFTLVT